LGDPVPMVIVGAKETGTFMGDCSATVLALSEPPQALPVVVVPLAIAPVCEEAHLAPPGFDQAVAVPSAGRAVVRRGRDVGQLSVVFEHAHPGGLCFVQASACDVEST
jgi:hypothetical protein